MLFIPAMSQQNVISVPVLRADAVKQAFTDLLMAVAEAIYSYRDFVVIDAHDLFPVKKDYIFSPPEFFIC